MAVVLLFSALLSLASFAGLLGLPLALILTSWFFKYAYILFDHTVRGFDDPPTLDIQMMNPVDEWRPLAQLIILGLIYGAATVAKGYLGTPAAITLVAIAAICLPASVAILGLDGNILKAANPIAWLRLIRGMGPLYGLVMLITLAYTAAVIYIGHLGLWLAAQLTATLFAILSIFSALGGALYERRDELGLETWASPERTEALRRKDELRQSETLVTEAYGLARARSHSQSWSLLQQWLSARGYLAEDYRWLLDHVASWDDPRYVTRLTEDHIERLLAAKHTGQALDAVTHRLAADPTFRPKTAADTLALAQLAARGGGARRVARTLLADFPTRFPGDPRINVAAALAQDLGAKTH